MYDPDDINRRSGHFPLRSGTWKFGDVQGYV